MCVVGGHCDRTKKDVPSRIKFERIKVAQRNQPCPAVFVILEASVGFDVEWESGLWGDSGYLIEVLLRAIDVVGASRDNACLDL